MCLKHLAGWRLLTLEAGAFRAELSGVRGRVQETGTRVGWAERSPALRLAVLGVGREPGSPPALPGPLPGGLADSRS